jgi:membrane protein DedA with SNARE-associated domain
MALPLALELSVSSLADGFGFATLPLEAFRLEDLQALMRQWGYGVIFLAMLLENAGLPLPGETVTLLGGYAAGSGELQLVGVIAAATSGAILGDNIGYWVGRRAGWPLLLRVGRFLRQSPEQMEALRTQFLRHAGKSVLLGRFVAVLRVLAGPMAGAVGHVTEAVGPGFVLLHFGGPPAWAAAEGLRLVPVLAQADAHWPQALEDAEGRLAREFDHMFHDR